MRGYTCDACGVFYNYDQPAATFDRRIDQYGNRVKSGHTPRPLDFCIGCALELVRAFEPELFLHEADPTVEPPDLADSDTATSDAT